MFGLTAYGNTPYAGAQNQDETLSVTPASPILLTVNVPITPIDVDVADLDGNAVTVSLLSGAIPVGLSNPFPSTQATPFTLQLTGTPTVIGTSNLVVRADDGEGSIYDLPIQINVVAPPVIMGEPQTLSRLFRIGRYFDGRIQ